MSVPASPDTDPASVAEPLNQIALSISGGGFRAAAFGLGCLSYLNHCQLTTNDGRTASLLERVRFIASASGGSFTNLLYAKYLYEEKSFEAMYHRLRDEMNGEGLLKRAMDLLNDEKNWHQNNHDKQRNLINAFSLAYDELFEGKTLGLFCAPDHQTTLDQVCINSTELKNGISFRFQNIDGKNRKGLVGNFGLYLRSRQLEVIGKLKLGDIMAASSCFPAGMEPIMFPQDFAYRAATAEQSLTQSDLRKAIYSRDAIAEAAKLVASEDSAIQAVSDTQLGVDAEAENQDDLFGQTPETLRQVTESFSFGLMDGGIDDNQAVKSLMLAEKRFQKSNGGKGYDTFIVCDVSGRYMAPYTLPGEPHNGLNKYSVRVLASGLAALLIMLALIVWNMIPNPQWQAGLVGSLLSLLLLEAGVLGWGWNQLRSAGRGTWGLIWHRYNGYFFKIPFGALRQMIATRLDSVVLLAGDVMMKQIRRLIFEQFYDNKDWENRRIATFLYALTSRNLPLTAVRGERATGQLGPIPSEAMQDVADAASKMNTTLWFNGLDVTTNSRDKLIATGQFTMYYTLLRYVDQVQNVAMTPAHQVALNTLRTQLLADWEIFQENPLSMI